MPTTDTATRHRKLFSEIARRYDFLNHLLSFNIDRIWRKRLVDSADPGPGENILDVCTGTGDVAIRFSQNDRAGHIVGIDLTGEMLRIARRKIARKELTGRIGLLEANALQLPFEDGSFDIVSVAFGLRNIGQHRRGIREMARVLRKGGRLLILEFSPPGGNLFGRTYRLYLNTFIQAIGGIISGSADAYRHLSESIAEFPKPEEILRLMEEEGLKRVGCEAQTGCIAYIYHGERGLS